MKPEELLAQPMEERVRVLGEMAGRQNGRRAHFGVEVACKDLNYSVGEKVILQNITCDLRPRTMTLVCGPPGCGKTSFMQALGGRINSEFLSGDISYNGDSRAKTDFVAQNFCSYVGQRDQHCENHGQNALCFWHGDSHPPKQRGR